MRQAHLKSAHRFDVPLLRHTQYPASVLDSHGVHFLEVARPKVEVKSPPHRIAITLIDIRIASFMFEANVAVSSLVSARELPGKSKAKY